MDQTPKLIKSIDAVSATTVGTPIDVRGAKKVVIRCQRANHSSGSTAFSVEGSIDKGITFDAVPVIDYIANANTATLVRTISKTSGTANGVFWLVLEADVLCLDQIRLTATETTDGTHSMWAYITY